MPWTPAHICADLQFSIALSWLHLLLREPRAFSLFLTLSLALPCSSPATAAAAAACLAICFLLFRQALARCLPATVFCVRPSGNAATLTEWASFAGLHCCRYKCFVSGVLESKARACKICSVSAQGRHIMCKRPLSFGLMMDTSCAQTIVTIGRSLPDYQPACPPGSATVHAGCNLAVDVPSNWW